ncbi:hypothetical protein DFJ58DRAFT_842797 [Suillus subalutaceus]|uniref:uncharacterized protein n=1 Tax=Suillus subalutaceus TaxID=48586 RepID=UPI001B8651B5|nr:uncharacterized protein DFJ58DRAFT_842797 [Suillus subalutaceus]KAG1848954.1 hypothetical protein DFJ58DRAFT_842797 [Suillus subalutaceus]
MIISLCAILFCVPFRPCIQQQHQNLMEHYLELWLDFVCVHMDCRPSEHSGYERGQVAVISRRLFIMVMALIAPELMITWATRQFFSAHEAAKDFNDRLSVQPTKAYSDRRDISGMTATPHRDIPEGSGSPSTPKPAMFRRLTMAHESFAWKHESGPVTEFEGWTVTHGYFAWMGGFMLYVNDEPRGTLTPNNLLQCVDEGSVDMPVISEAEVEDQSKGDGLLKGFAILQLVWFVVQLFARYVQNLPITLLEIDTLAVTALTCISYGLWWKKPKDVRCPYIVHWKGTANQLSQLTYDQADLDRLRGGRLRGLTYPFISLMGIQPLISPRAASSRRVPSLGGYGWNYLFQTYTQHMLWRAASLGIAETTTYLAEKHIPLSSRLATRSNANIVKVFPQTRNAMRLQKVGLRVPIIWNLDQEN